MKAKPFHPDMNRPRKPIPGAVLALGLFCALVGSAAYGPDLSRTFGALLRWFFVAVCAAVLLVSWVWILRACWRGLDEWMEDE